MVICSFCGKEFPKATGKMYVKKDGTLFLFCSNKCEKNMLVLKRKPRKVGWTAEYHKVKRIERGIEKETVKKEEKTEKKTKVKKKDGKRVKKKVKRREKRKKTKVKKR